MTNFPNLGAPAGLGVLTPHTPSALLKLKPKPVYWLRSGSFIERAQYLAAIDDVAGREVSQFQKDAAFNDGLNALLADNPAYPDNAEQRARYSELLSQNRSGQDLPEGELKDLDKMWLAVSERWPPLKTLQDREALRETILPGLALKFYCVKIDNAKDRFGNPLIFEKDEAGQMSDAAIMRMDAELQSVGIFAHNLQFGVSAEKNSDLPSSSEGDSESLTEALVDHGVSAPTISEPPKT
jgi:hypothetical protein